MGHLIIDHHSLHLVYKLCVSHHNSIRASKYLIAIFPHLKVCLATATHTFKWVKITEICLILDQTFENLHV